MRFEVFDGARSVASLAFDPSGAVVMRLHDPAERAYLLEHFGGASTHSDGDELVLRGDWTPLAFEIACLALGRERGFSVVARTAGQASGE